MTYDEYLAKWEREYGGDKPKVRTINNGGSTVIVGCPKLSKTNWEFLQRKYKEDNDFWAKATLLEE